MIESKRIIVATILVLVFYGSVGYSQNYYDENKPYEEMAYIPESYIGIGTGLNEIGILGIAGEIPVSDRLSAAGTLGIGGWGYKFRAGINYYPNELSGKSSFGVRYAWSSGLDGFEYVDDNGNPTYLLNLFPAHNLDFLYNRNLFVGKKSKFVFTAGYSLSLNRMAYEEVNGQTIDVTTQQVLELLQPGGFLLGIKFLFGN